MLSVCIQLMVMAVSAQQKMTLSGSVKDSAMNGVTGAYIHLLNTGATAVANTNGDFIIPNIYPGIYTAEISALGFAAKTQKVMVNDRSNPLAVTLQRSPAVLDEVVVTAQKEKNGRRMCRLALPPYRQSRLRITGFGTVKT